MFILTVYLVCSVLLHICLTDDRYDPSCPDANLWSSLNDLIPNREECGKRKLNVESTEAKNNVTQHYTNLGQYPFLVHIRTEMTLIDKDGKETEAFTNCNGVIITKIHIMTAANCLQEKPVPRYRRIKRAVKVTLGDYKPEVTAKDCVSNEFNTTCAPPAFALLGVEVYAHDQFSPFSMHNDIAIVKLERYVDFTDFIQPICLPIGCDFKAYEALLVDKEFLNVGWRIFWPNKNRTAPPYAQQKRMRINIDPPANSKHSCQEVYNWFEKTTQLCTRDFPDEPDDQVNCDIWQGGPFFYDDPDQITLLGISSYGESCEIERVLSGGDPTVMTWIPAYMSWILKTLSNQNTDVEREGPDK